MKEFLLNKIKATGTTTGDVYFPQTKLLLPFNGTNGAQVTSDSSNRNATVTFNGNASLSTAQSKFGGSSLYLDGTGDSVSISDTYWNTAINSGDFTIEFWVRFTVDEISHPLNNKPSGSVSSTNGWGIINSGDFTIEFWVRFTVDEISYPLNNKPSGSVSSTNGWGIQRYASANYQGQIIFWFRDSSGWQYINLSQGTRTTISEDTWYHVAVTRNSNTWKLFLDGTAEDTITNSNSIVASTDGELMMGEWMTSDLTGYLDDIRITPGIARYTSNFTAPTIALPTSAGDVNKQILINETADGVAIGTGGINQARIAKAWCNWNGAGTVAIRKSYNISSVTDRGVGLYTLNYSTALTDADCSGAGAAVDATGDITERNRVVTLIPNNTSSSYVNAFSIDSPVGADDCEIITFLIFGN